MKSVRADGWLLFLERRGKVLKYVLERMVLLNEIKEGCIFGSDLS